MTGPIETFFGAWGTIDDAERADTIASVYAEHGRYADPRTPDVLIGPAAIADHVGMFGADAPGWTAKVVKSDGIAGTSRVTVAFGGRGPDGAKMVQHGQYFVEEQGGRITRMTGFGGTGAVD